MSAVEAVWTLWIEHVTQCKGPCRTDGLDCARAVELRQKLREAREAEIQAARKAALCEAIEREAEQSTTTR